MASLPDGLLLPEDNAIRIDSLERKVAQIKSNQEHIEETLKYLKNFSQRGSDISKEIIDVLQKLAESMQHS